ncbi:MAG: sodium/solute symporter [Cyclobacteriaceae bacterium]|nr:sodium/solute symporter [Cyclobacteriaceae bacterium]
MLQVNTPLYTIVHLWIGLFIWLLPLQADANSKGAINQIRQEVILNLSDEATIIGNEGLAGMFCGVHQHTLILAGGTAFPDGKPWENGKKHFSQSILCYTRTKDGKLQKSSYSAQLPFGLGEGASASTPQGLVCIGGLTENGLSDQVFLLSIISDGITIEHLPSLPAGIKHSAAVSIGSKVYMIGGETDQGPVKQFLMLDLSNLQAGWQSLPDFPEPVSAAAAAVQMDGEGLSIYVFGGRALLQGHTKTTFYSYNYRFSFKSSSWHAKKNIASAGNASFSLAAANASALGASHIIITGGDPGHTYNQVEKAIHDMQGLMPGARQKRDSLWQSHPGFNEKILVYNTITDSWFEAGAWRGIPVAVAPAIVWNGQIIVAAGEIRPGIRNPEIHQIIFTTEPLFGWVNYMVLILYFVAMLMLGFFFMKKGGDTDQFFKAGGKIPWWAAGISIFATTLSAITFIAIPAKSYATDWRMFIFNMTIIMMVPFVVRFFLPFFRRYNFDTAYHYLGLRFNSIVRWIAATLFVLFMITRIAIVLFLPSLALNAVTGFSIFWAIVIMGLVTIIYCTSGGIEAVIWGDVIQGFILLFGAITALFFLIYGTEGGMEGFIAIAKDNQKFRTLDFSFDLSQPVLWVVLIGGLANSMISYTSDQSVVQRYMTTKNEKETARSIWLNGYLSIPVALIFFTLGTALFSFYYSNAERLSVTNPNIDSVFPQFIVSQMPAGISGLLISAIFAAAMSTLSSNINSVAAVITSDLFGTLTNQQSQGRKMQVARWSGILTGLSGIAMAVMLANWNIASLWDQFNTFLGLLTGSLCALFIMGIFFDRISGTAAIGGTFIGLVFLLLIRQYTSLSFLLFGFFGICLSISSALLLSILFPQKDDKTGYTWKTRKPVK